jgi:hypothetical protein
MMKLPQNQDDPGILPKLAADSTSRYFAANADVTTSGSTFENTSLIIGFATLESKSAINIHDIASEVENDT